MSGNELSVWLLQSPEEQPSNYLKQVGYHIYVAILKRKIRHETMKSSDQCCFLT